MKLSASDFISAPESKDACVGKNIWYRLLLSSSQIKYTHTFPLRCPRKILYRRSALDGKQSSMFVWPNCTKLLNRPDGFFSSYIRVLRFSIVSRRFVFQRSASTLIMCHSFILHSTYMDACSRDVWAACK